MSHVPVGVYLRGESVLKKLCKTQLAKTSFMVVSGPAAIEVKKNQNLLTRISNVFLRTYN